MLAIQAYGQAHRLVRKHNLWKWIIIPGLVYMLLFCISMYFFGKSAMHVIDFFMIKTGLRNWAHAMHSRLVGFFYHFGWDNALADIDAVLFFAFQIFMVDYWLTNFCLPE